MNSFRLASRSLFRKGRGNVIKIVSLGLGLAVGLVLITKVFFEYNYESFYPDAGRVYEIICTYLGRNEAGEMSEHGDDSTISGGVAPAMGREIPQVEAATRFFYLGYGEKLLNPARQVVEANVILADSCLHDVLPRPMVHGDAKRILSTPMSAIVSQELAAKLGIEIGQAVEFDQYPGRSVTVEGIFEDIPENSDFRYDMAISLLPSISNFTWDGTDLWEGNDRYYSFLKLYPGADAGEMTRLMREVQERHISVEQYAAAGVDIRCWLIPLLRVHSDDPDIKKSNLLMLALAVSMIVIALLNYLIITLSTVLKRAREIAIHKCHGADGGDIRRQVLAEAALHIALSLAVAALLVAAFVDPVQEILRTPLAALFSWQSVAIVAGVCALLIAIATWIPSRLFANVPAASVMTSFRRSRKTWKLALLFIQFIYAAAFFAILVVIWGQYSMMMTSDPGYKFENVVFANVAGTSQNERAVAVANLEAMPGVEMVSTAYQPLFYGASGNNVYLPGDERELFNIADLDEANANYFEMMEIPIIEGRGFERGVTTPTDIIVNRPFADRISRIAGWDDGVIGKTVFITGHDPLEEFNIVGVFRDFRLGTINGLDGRPKTLFYSEEYQNFVWVKLREVNGETMRAVQDVLTRAMPDKQINVIAAKSHIAGRYNGERIERNSIVLCSIITLLIVLLGLVGYLTSEITRRSAEIAIRKINGAGTGDVLQLLGREILWVALPALAAGSLIAYWVSRQWISGFSEQIALTPWLYLASGAAVLAVILAVAVASTYRIAVQNPVDSLKKDE